MLTEDKVTEIFFMADEFCKFFDRITKKYIIEDPSKRKYHRDSTLSKAEVMLIMILFHDSGYRCLKDRILLRKRAIIETINDELKNIAQVEHSRHRCFDNFFVNTISAIAAYCCFPKKPAIQVVKYTDNQLTLF